MTISCADPLALPATQGTTWARNFIERPNAYKLTANAPREIMVPKPSYLLVTCATLPTVSAFPGIVSGTPATLSEVYTATQVGATTVLLYFHAPGTWTVTSTVTSTASVLFDSYDGVTPLLRALKAVSIVGGTTGLAADSGLYSDFVDLTLAAQSALNVRALIGGRSVAGTLAKVPTADRLDSIRGNAGNALWGAVVANIAYAADAAGVIMETVGVREVSGGSVVPGGLDARANAFWSAIKARRFTLARKDGGLFQSASAFSATDPQVLCVAPATNEWMIRRITVEMAETNAGNTYVYVVVDPDNRYSSGGTTFIPTNNFQNTNRGVAGTLTPTQAVFDDGTTAITATAADDDEWYSEVRVIPQWGANGGVKNATVFEFDDGLIVPAGGSILIYVWNGTAEVDGSFGIELESSNVQ